MFRKKLSSTKKKTEALLAEFEKIKAKNKGPDYSTVKMLNESRAADGTPITGYIFMHNFCVYFIISMSDPDIYLISYS